MQGRLRAVLLVVGVVSMGLAPRVLAHTDIFPERARDLIAAREDIVVVDVRERSEYCDAGGHISGAVNYPWNSGVLRERYGELPKGSPILVVCLSGGRSNQAASFLESQGFANVYDMTGGMNAWFWETLPCKYAGGSGTPKDPYRIATADDLQAVGADPNEWDKYFKLVADIDLSAYAGNQFNIIGTGYKHPFSGVFDGNGHTIANLTWDSEDGEYIGLIGYMLGEDAEVRNLGMLDPEISVGSGRQAGSLVGLLNQGTVTCCYVEGGRIAGYEYIGGLVGTNNGTVTECYAVADVTAYRAVGCLAGSNSGSILCCYAMGSAAGQWYTGGLVGMAGSKNTIGHCYAVATLAGSGCTGGLVGYNTGCQVVGSFWDVKVSAYHQSQGGTGETTERLKTASSFVGWAPADREAVWTIDEGQDYPRLRWEGRPGEVLRTTPLSDWLAGAGTAEDPFLIGNAEDFNRIGCFPYEWDKHFMLTDDLDFTACSEAPFNIIGVGVLPFTGVFDGNRHMLSGFQYSSPYSSSYGSDIGLFGCVGGPDAAIHDVGVLAPRIDVRGGSYVGSLVGRLEGGTIRDCHVEDARVNGSACVGGLVGMVSRGTVARCRATGEITSRNMVGGLVGSNAGVIADCHVTATVSGERTVGGLVGDNSNYAAITNCHGQVVVSGERIVGGLIGHNSYYSEIANCHANGDVTAESNAGGLLGENRYYSILTHCYSTCAVDSNDAGGLIGFDETGRVYGCFWDIESSGQMTSSGGTGLTTEQMSDPSQFRAAGWDFFGPDDGPSDVWIMDGDTGCPFLWSQVSEDRWPALPQFSGGSGTAETPYRISSAGDLALIGHNPRLMEAHFALTSDIDLTGTSLPRIGDEGCPFSGVFDGNGKTISGFTRVSDNRDYIGLFGYVRGRQAHIMNLGLTDPDIDAGQGDYAGSMVGYLREGSLSHCRATGGIVAAREYVGGLVGYNLRGTLSRCSAGCEVVGGRHPNAPAAIPPIEGKYVGGLIGRNEGLVADCKATGKVTAVAYAGGLIGYNYAGTTLNCCATGAVAADRVVGGLVAYNSSSTLANCYARGAVTALGWAGGLVGAQRWEAAIRNCYATGTVRLAYTEVGGLLGHDEGAETRASFWDVDASGQVASQGGAGRRTLEMVHAATYLEAGWDFVDETENGTDDLWWIDEGSDYPRLSWELEEASL